MRKNGERSWKCVSRLKARAQLRSRSNSPRRVLDHMEERYRTNCTCETTRDTLVRLTEPTMTSDSSWDPSRRCVPLGSSRRPRITAKPDCIPSLETVMRSWSRGLRPGVGDSKVESIFFVSIQSVSLVTMIRYSRKKQKHLVLYLLLS